MTHRNSIYLAALLATFLVFFVNAIIPSFVNGFTPGLNFDLGRLYENVRAEALCFGRSADSEFARKLIVLNLQKWALNLGIPAQLSFNIINFIGLFLFFSSSYK